MYPCESHPVVRQRVRLWLTNRHRIFKRYAVPRLHFFQLSTPQDQEDVRAEVQKLVEEANDEARRQWRLKWNYDIIDDCPVTVKGEDGEEQQQAQQHNHVRENKDQSADVRVEGEEQQALMDERDERREENGTDDDVLADYDDSIDSISSSSLIEQMRHSTVTTPTADTSSSQP